MISSGAPLPASRSITSPLLHQRLLVSAQYIVSSFQSACMRKVAVGQDEVFFHGPCADLMAVM